MSEDDWTRDPMTGRSNTSAEFVRLVGEVERLIRDDAHALIAGRARDTAGLIMAQLAHVHGLAPCGEDDEPVLPPPDLAIMDTLQRGGE